MSMTVGKGWPEKGWHNECARHAGVPGAGPEFAAARRCSGGRLTNPHRPTYAQHMEKVKLSS